MTQEQKDLLLKDICARLPYKVKVLCLRDFNHDWYNLEMVDIGDNEVYVTTYESYANRYVKIEEVKPYLFPFSSMAEEQLKLFDGVFLPNGHVVASDFGFDYLNSIHVDYRGLIPMGLAIDATGLNIY